MTFVKGQSGNPNGRPKGTLSITKLIKEKLQELPTKTSKKTYVEQFVQKLLNKAIKTGDTVTQKMIWNYIDGLPRETVDLEVKLPKPMMDVTKKNGILNNLRNSQDKESQQKD